MASIKFAVCDDDELICEAVGSKISSFFVAHGYEAQCSKFTLPVSLYKCVKNGEKYDIAFLDIDMPTLGGIKLAKEIRKLEGKDMKIIFISNREDKVFETFSVQPFGFIRKNNFARDMADCLGEYLHEKAADSSFLVVKTNNNSVVRQLKAAEIVYIESYKSSQTVYMAGGEAIEIHMTMDELEEKLKDSDILRIYKGYLVNMSFVRKIERTGVYVEYNGEEICLNISRNKVNDIKDMYMNYLRRTGSVLSGRSSQ